MDKILLDAIDKMTNTLSKVGDIKKANILNLYVILFMDKLYKGHLYKYITDEDKLFLNETAQCLADNSCLFNNKDLPEFTQGQSDKTDAIITIIEEYITTQENDLTVPINGGTKKFTDFAFKPYMELDDSVYTVGYDSDENKEVRINVTDLGIFWE